MRRLRAVILATLGGWMLLSGALTNAQMAKTPDNAYPNYDARESESSLGRSKTANAASVRVRPVLAAMSEAAGTLAARVQSLRLEKNLRGTALEIVGTESAEEFLTPDSSAPMAKTARQFISEQAALYGLTSDQVLALVKSADYTNPAGNMGWVEFRQQANGIPIFQAELRAAFTAHGALARTTGNLVPALDYTALPTKPALTPAEAAARAAASIGWTVEAAKFASGVQTESARRAVLGNGPFERPVHTELVYFSRTPGTATLAYSMVLWEPVDAYYILVDANDGTLLWRKNITDHQTQSATYTVYTDDSPAPLSPSMVLPGQGTQPPAIGRTTITLIGNEPPNTFNNLGWMTDGVNVTTGNNVNCGLDLTAPNGIDTAIPGQATGSPNRVFTFNFDPAPGGTDSPATSTSRSGAVTNLFYWTNVYHDRLYLLGFTEVARNFQTNNFGRNPGGITPNAIAGSDAVLAEVQDYSGTNNANFSTAADGATGRMQMYLFDSPSPFRDGSLDADVFLHELTHGTSNRLHNNAAGLTTLQGMGLGEGWSDFYARVLLSSAGEDVHGVFAPGAYSNYLFLGLSDNYYYGIRHFPYAIKSSVGANGKPHNPLTLADLDAARYYIDDGAYPRSPATDYGATSEVHFTGEFWCVTLLEFRARLIDRLGFALGNDRALQIITDAMKLDPTDPTITQARDSIIAAANAGVGGAADALDARIAFATRGLGPGSSLTVRFVAVESFLPDLSLGAVTFTDTLGNNNGAADPGEDLVVSVSLTNPLTTANGAVTGVVANYTASYGSIGASGTVARTFAYRVPANAVAGELLSIPISVTSAAGTFTTNFPLRIGAPTNTLLENFDAVTPPALPAGWTTTTAALAGGMAGTPWATTTANTVDVANNVSAPAGAGNNTAGGETSLISPPISLPAGGAQLSFKHRYLFESGGNATGTDGGVLEIKIGAGAFTDIIAAGGSFVQAGYFASLISQSTKNPLSKRPAFTNTPTITVTSIINLPASAAGESVQFRWRIGFDATVGTSGWNVDTISLTSFAAATIDSDGDGIPNGWETLYTLNPLDPNDANADLDGDGMTNLAEYLAGTIPNNRSSVLRITQISRDPVTGAGSLTFPSVNGRLYRVEFNDDITVPNGWMTVIDNVVGTGNAVPISDPGATGKSKRFYRTRVL